MLNHLISFSLRHRILVLAAACSVLVFGTMTLLQLPIDVLPDITKPTLTVLTEGHGMAPEEVEVQITHPLESALLGLPGIERVRSQSGVGLSIIYLEFSWGGDIYRHRQNAQERLELARSHLPSDVTPTIGPIGSLMGQIQQIVVFSENQKISSMDLRSFAEFNLKPQLMMIPGVSQILAIGGELKQYQIQIDASRLTQYQLSLQQLESALQGISRNTTGGVLENSGVESLIRNIGASENLEDIENTFVGYHLGRVIQVKDLAKVTVGSQVKRGDGSYNTKPSVVLTVQKQPGADTVQITKEIERLITRLAPQFPEGLQIKTDVFQQARFIENSLQGIQQKLQIGSILVFLILLLFLANMRMSLITLTAIPLSFLITAITFKFFGLTVNTMTLGGLAIAIGELVDDSIVDVENIFRRLRENSLSLNPLPRLQVIYDASKEVRNSIVIATLLIALVFLPLFALDGIEGRLFAPLAFAYLISLLASLVVSLSVTPVLSFYLLKDQKDQHRDTQIVRWLKDMDQKVLNWCFLNFKTLATVTGSLFLASLILVFNMGRDFLPKFNEGSALVTLIAAPGTSLSGSQEIGLEAEKIILQHPEIASVSRRTGRAEQDEHAMGINISEIDVLFKDPNKNHEEVLVKIRSQLKVAFPSVGVNMGQPLSHLIDHMLTGVSSALALKIFGPDLEILKEKAIEAEGLLKDIPGLADLRIEAQANIPQVKVYILKGEAARRGVNVGELTEALETSLYGKNIAKIYENGAVIDLNLRLRQEGTRDLESLENLMIKIAPNGDQIRLSDIADIYESTGPNEIHKENAIRRIVVSANSEGRDIASLANEISSKLNRELKLPEGYSFTLGGQFESQKRASERLLLFGLLAIVGIILLLYTQFHSGQIVLQIIATLPLAFIGGVIALYLLDGTITIASLVGFITLLGISSRNSIMMISHYLHLLKYENETFSKEMIIRGSQERIVPVLMTASVAGLALLPIVFSKHQPGSEVLFPVATVIVGGLITSTLLDLLITPTLFYLFGEKAAQKFIKK